MKLTIGRKLGLTFGAILFLMLASSLLSYWRLQEIVKIQDYLLEVRVPSIERLKALQSDLNNSGLAVRRVVLAAGQTERRAQAMQKFDVAWVAVNQDVKDLQGLAPRWLQQENRDRLDRMVEQIPQLIQVSNDSVELSSTRAPDAMASAGNLLTDKASAINGVIQKNLGDMVASQLDLLKSDNVQIAKAKSVLYWTMGLGTLISLIIGSLVATRLSHRFTRTIAAILGKAQAIAAGDLAGSAITVASADELGDLTKAVNNMSDNLRNIVESISENAQNVANSSEEFSSVSLQISANSEETSAQANAVSTATDEMNHNLQTVATATEEMSASISEIAKSATEAAKVAEDGMKTAEETNKVVGKLGESSAEIGLVVKVITNIAQQTNLLALNATIEAARAGDVGKGFAVVANEVKELAKATAKATEDIGRKIEAIQTDAKGAMQAISAISEVIARVNEISGTIASAVEEQSVTTNEMSRNLTEAAKGANQVTQNIGGVAQAAQNTSHGATDSQKAAKQLAEMSTQLRGLVDQFKLDDQDSRNGHPTRRSSGGRGKETAKARQEEEVLVR